MFEEKIKAIFDKFPTLFQNKLLNNKIITNFTQFIENQLHQGKNQDEIIFQLETNLNNLKEILNKINTEKNLKIKNKLQKDLLQVLELKLVNQLEVNITDISELHLNYHIGDLIILPSKTDKIKIFDFMSRDISKLYSLVEKIGNVIKIQQGPRKLVGIFKNKVIIALPNNYASFLTIKAQSGKILISNLNSKCMLDLTANSGDVIINHTKVKRIQTDVKSSAIAINNCQSNDYHLNSHSGNITLTNINSQQEISIASSSGNIKFNNINSKRLIFEVKNGNISGDKLHSHLLESKTITGNLKISHLDSSGEINTDLGKVKLDLINNYQGSLSATSNAGNITVILPSALAIKFKTKTNLGAIELPMDAIIYGNDDFSQMDGYLVSANTSSQLILTSKVGKIEIKK